MSVWKYWKMGLTSSRAPSEEPSFSKLGEVTKGGGLSVLPPRPAAPVTPIALPPDAKRGQLAARVEEALSAEEAASWIALSEASGGYVDATLNAGGGYEVLARDIRNSQRWLVDVTPDVISSLWDRIKHAVPEDIVPGWRPIGLNERLRFLRYHPGQSFERHRDGVFQRVPLEEESRLTLLLYLNEGYEGGFTTFYSAAGNDGNKLTGKEPDAVPVIPATGLALIQDHRLLHGVPPLLKGVKYVVRTDIMFKRLHDDDGKDEAAAAASPAAAGGAGGTAAAVQEEPRQAPSAAEAEMREAAAAAAAAAAARVGKPA